jgi:hypothetical protein
MLHTWTAHTAQQSSTQEQEGAQPEHNGMPSKVILFKARVSQSTAYVVWLKAQIVLRRNRRTCLILQSWVSNDHAIYLMYIATNCIQTLLQSRPADPKVTQTRLYPVVDRHGGDLRAGFCLWPHWETRDQPDLSRPPLQRQILWASSCTSLLKACLPYISSGSLTD